jgi:hypothetical protein
MPVGVYEYLLVFIVGQRILTGNLKEMYIFGHISQQKMTISFVISVHSFAGIMLTSSMKLSVWDLH